MNEEMEREKENRGWKEEEEKARRVRKGREDMEGNGRRKREGEEKENCRVRDWEGRERQVKVGRRKQERIRERALQVKILGREMKEMAGRREGKGKGNEGNGEERK